MGKRGEGLTFRLALDGIGSSLAEHGGIDGEGAREGKSSGELHGYEYETKNGRSRSSSNERLSKDLYKQKLPKAYPNPREGPRPSYVDGKFDPPSQNVPLYIASNYSVLQSCTSGTSSREQGCLDALMLCIGVRPRIQWSRNGATCGLGGVCLACSDPRWVFYCFRNTGCTLEGRHPRNVVRPEPPIRLAAPGENTTASFPSPYARILLGGNMIYLVNNGGECT